VTQATGQIKLSAPWIDERDEELVLEVLRSGWLSLGPAGPRFEAMLAEAVGAPHCAAVSSGTTGLHLCVRVAGVGAGDEVIMPALTFVATANAAHYCGAVPHFVDSTEHGLGLDAEKLDAHLQRIAARRDGALVNRDTGRPIRAILPVHILGHPADMDAINAIGERYGIAVIEDATEALGSRYHGRPCGGISRIGTLSFNGNKIVTTGGGGAILTNDEALARRAKHLTTTAKLPHKWAFVHDEAGWNYRLPNLNAALGLAQLERLEKFVAAKRRLAQRYFDVFADMPGVRCVREPAGTESNYWLNAILLDDDSGAARDAVLTATHEAGLLTRPAWTPLHRLPMYADCPRGDLSVAESIERRLVKLPSSAALGMQL
jgi:perosamine synthetase